MLMLALLLSAAIVLAVGEDRQLPADREAARRARYYFASDVEDHMSAVKQHRDEVRDGLKVRGSFSYSDGFHRREVKYEADENGYRVIRDEIQPLPGPKVNPKGTNSTPVVMDGAEIRNSLTRVPEEKK
ncbi:uncharacterized protein [Periplaneta americana]|uniref:uncharacterized protein n=1 Tax=Periplaneta americana TaxID=6978 RepID=UPI0037E96D43